MQLNGEDRITLSTVGDVEESTAAAECHPGRFYVLRARTTLQRNPALKHGTSHFYFINSMSLSVENYLFSPSAPFQ